MADQPPAIDPNEQERLKGIFGSSVVQKSNFINQPALPNYSDFMKYLRLNQGKMTYPLATNPMRIQYNNVVNYKSPYYDDLPMRHATPEGRQFTYWEYPQRVARFANMIRTAPPDWQPPDWMDRDKVLEAYDYMKARNGTGDWTQWKALNDDDPGVEFLQSLAPPPIEFVLPSEQKQAQQVLTPEQIAQQQPVDWDTLPKWMKNYLGIFAPQAEGISDRPNANRLTASALQSLMIGIGVGAGVSAIATPWVGVPVGLGVMGLLTYQNYTGNQIPGLNEIMIPFNILAEMTESTIGNVMLASVEGLPEVMDDIPSAYRSGMTAYETWKVSNIPNVFAKLAGNYEGPIAGSDEVWKISQGMLTPQKAPYGKGGEAISHYHEWIESGDALAEFMELKNAGQTRGRFLDYITQKVYEDYGDTAISNDIVWQTTLDPLNFAPFGVGKAGQFVTGKIAKGATDVNLIRVATQMNEAFKVGTGNPFMDALPIGVQQLAKAVTGIQDSAGLIGTYKIYQGMIRGNYLSALAKSAPADLLAKVDTLVKEGVKADEIKFLDDTITWKDKDGVEQVYKSPEQSRIEIPEIDDLSDFEKLIGGIDEEYGLKELRPVVGEKWVKKLSKLTPAAQVTAIMNTFHQNFASLMDAAQGDPAIMTKLLKQMAGQIGIEKGDLGESILKSAESRAVQAALKYSLEDGDVIDNIYSSWVMGAERRSMLEKIAIALDEKPADVLQGLKDKPDVMAKRLNKIAPELNTTPEVLTETLKIFTGDDALPWSVEQFQASMVVKAADRMDDYFKDVYGLKEEPYVYRLSNAFKSVQSLVLLGFNPAYFMNNWINNLVTRSAEGVGGYMTARQINDFYERMGMFPKDTGLSGYDDITGRVVHEAMEVKDNLGKIQKMLTKVNNKIGVFSRLSGWSEKLEGNQARVSAAKQFLGKEKKVGTGVRPMDPISERILDQAYPGLKEGIYGAVNAGMNMREIEGSIKAQVVTPKIESILDEIGVKYDKTVPGGARDLFDRMGLTDRLNDRLANADTDAKVDAAFDAVVNDVDDFIQKRHVEQLKGEAEATKNLVQAERGPAILQIMAQQAIDFGQTWENFRADYDRLYARLEAGEFEYAHFVKELEYLDAKHQAKVKRDNEINLQQYKGIVEGVGIDNEYTRGFINRIGDVQAVWSDFWQTRRKLFKEYNQRSKRGKGETYDSWMVRKNDLWGKLQDALEKKYDLATDNEFKLQQDLDTNFSKMYAEYTGWDIQNVAAYRAQLQKMRDAIIKAQKEVRNKTKGMTIAEKEVVYQDFNPEYNRMIAEYKQFEHDGAYELMNKPVPEARIEIPEVERPINPNIEDMSIAREGEMGEGIALTDEAWALMKEEAVNAGLTPEQAEGMNPKQLAEYVNNQRRLATTAAKGENEQAIINKMKLDAGKDVVKAKITAEDIMAEANDKLREGMLSDNGMIGREDYKTQMLEADPKATEVEIEAAVAINDLMINQWAKKQGLVPSKAVRDAWYATNIAGVKKETGGLQPGELPLANKGAAQRLADGRTMIKFFETADFSTAVHEPMHVWLWNLPVRDIDVVARLGGLSGADEFRLLREQFNDGTLTQGMTDYDRYVRAEEDFARGDERYLTEGDAPTPELRSLFRQFTDWMMSIYQALQKTMGRVTGFEQTKIGVDIRTQVNGRSLRDIFDGMLVDKVDRSPTFDQLVSDRFTDVQSRGRNAVRFKDQPAELTKMAQRELIGEMFKDFASQDEARAYVDGMTDYVDMPDGTRLDDVALYDGLRFIDDNPDMNPWNVVVTKKVAGKKITADTPTGDTVNMQYKVVDLDDIEASDNWFGNEMQPNPNYSQELQKRIRGEKSSIAWMMDKSKPETFNPKLVLDEYNATDRGTPIIAYDNQVWSGNGRVNLLRYGLSQDLGTYEAYRAALDSYAAKAGIDPESYSDMQRPFLVREITDDLTPDQLEKWAADSNKQSSASMSDFEKAVNDGAQITDEALMMLEVGDAETIEGALLAARNQEFVTSYLSRFDEMELKDISYNLKLTDAGIDRIVKALLAKVYQGVSGEKIVRIVANGDKSLVKNQLKVLKDTLPQMAVLEGRIGIKALDDSLRMSDDLSVAIDVLDRIRQNPKMNVNEYLNTQQIIRETTPFQDLLIDFLDTSKPTEARQTIRNYVELAMREPDPRQPSMFGETITRSKEEIFNDARTVGKLEADEIDARISAGAAASQVAAPISGLPEQPINAGAGEGTGGVLRGSEAVSGIPGQEIPRPASGELVAGAEQPAVRQPWEMTRGEWKLAHDKGQFNTFGLDNNKSNATQTIANIENHAFLNYGTEGRMTSVGKRRPDHKQVIEKAIREGKPVPPEVLADYPDLVAKNVIDSETKADYDAGKPVPIERAAEIDLTHTEEIGVPTEVQALIDGAESFPFEKRDQARDYVRWILGGEKEVKPRVSQLVRDAYSGGNLELLREYAAQKARGVTAEVATPKEPMQVTPESLQAAIALRKQGKLQIQDRYQIMRVPKVEKGIDSRGEMRYGYEYSPDAFIKSDASGMPMRHFIVLDNGAVVHPDELGRVYFDKAGKVVLESEKFSVSEPGIRKKTSKSLNDAAWNTQRYEKVEKSQTGLTPLLLISPDEPITITSSGGYEITLSRREWGKVIKESRNLNFAQWLDLYGEKYGDAIKPPAKLVTDTPQPGINITKVFAFKHGDTEIVANVYKDGELIAYAPAVPLKDAQLDADTRILGLDPQFPDKWVYEQDGVIKTVDSRKPEIATGKTLRQEILETFNDKPIPWSRVLDKVDSKYESQEVAREIRLMTEEGLLVKSEGMARGSNYKTGRTVELYSRNPEIGGEQTLFQQGQTDIFNQSAADMPLFSGTPMRAEQGMFAPKDTSGQMSMFPDVVPEVKPTTIIEIAIKEKGATSYIRLDIKKTKAIRDTIALHEGAEMTARIMDAKGKVIESNLDPNSVISPKMGGNALFQTAEPVDTPEFKQWFGNGVVDENDKPLRVYHGTFSDFTEFDMSRASEEAFLGKAIHFTDDPVDASAYADLNSPDPQGKISRLIDEIEGTDDVYNIITPISEATGISIDKLSEIMDAGIDEWNTFFTDDVKRKVAIHMMGAKNEGVVIPAYLAMQNKFNMIDDSNGTKIYMETKYDIDELKQLIQERANDYPDEFDGKTKFTDKQLQKMAESREYDWIEQENGYEPEIKFTDNTGREFDLYQAIRDAAYEFEIDPDKIISALMEEYGYEDLAISGKELHDFLKKQDEVIYAEGEINGNYALVGNQFINEVISNMGYDGVIMDAYSYFGERDVKAGYGTIHLKGMEQIDPDTKHYLIFDPTKAKSIFNEGTWDKRNRNMLKQSAEPLPDNTAPIGKVPLNGTPTIEPYARVLDEINSEHIRPLMDDIKQSYKEKLKNPGYKWGEVAAEHQKIVSDYLKGTVNNDLATVKNQAMKYGQMMRNNALLDYSRRYGADAVLQTVFPYQFWYTRTMMNWAKRMVDKPAWFAMYARMQASREKLEREGMPTRLRGKMRINMPWMPEWMGGGIWTDPMSKIFPFHQFGQPIEQYGNNQVMINRRAESILDEMKDNELISAADAENAKSTRAGTVWENALAQAELELDKSANPTSLVTMMMQPALWWTIPSQIAKGTPEKMSPLPITRTGQTIKELGRDTFLEPMTDVVGGLMAGPETAIRKKAGLSEFGQWGDYYIDRMLAGMAADGEISTEDARIAMIDRQGPAFQEALQRIRTEQSLRTPGALGITAAKEGAKPGQILAATLAGIFGGSIFSEGEMKMRGLKPIYDNAWNKLKAGDESALNDFYADYPEYSARLALYDEPEERLHQFLIDNVWRGYMDLDSANKKLVNDALGDEFMDSFLNKETRSYESIDDKTLAMWTQTIKQGTQKMPEAMGEVEGQNIEYYDEPMLQEINAYKDERTQRFPNYYMWQNAYYELPAGAERKAFLAQYPGLKKYWDWKDEYADTHPEIIPYFDDLKQKSTGDIVSSELTQPLIRQLYTYATGGSLSAGAKSELERIRKQYASEMSSEEFIMLALALIMGDDK